VSIWEKIIMNKIEIKIVRYFNNIGGKKVDTFLAFINAVLFLAIFWTALVALAIFKHPEITKSFLMAVFIVTVLHFVITEGVIKHLLVHVFKKRKRPYVDFPEQIKPIGKKFSDSSFPSSHMVTTVAMLFVITSFYPSLIIASVVFILLMAFSRLHNGMHFPSDILAGTILGLGYGWAALEIVRILS
jgi:undecaprenyl-diphosphatase